jgi:hypothetical protein
MQDRHKGRPETIGFTLSAAVPVEAVGFVLKAMFDAGCPPNGLDIKAIIGGGTNGHATAIDAPAAPALPRQQKHASNFRAEHIREAMLAILSARSSIQRKELFAAVREKLGEAIHEARLSNVVSTFMSSDVISSNGNGLYTLTKTGIREASHEPAPAHMTNADFAYSVIKAEPLRKFHLKEIEAAFEADGRAPSSAKDTVSRLAQKGIIKRTHPRTFMLAPGA